MSLEHRAAPRPLRILVTGAAGLVGRELCGVLTERGHSVVALVHRSRALARNDGRPIATMPWTAAMPPAGIVTLLSGDVTAEMLGLAPALLEDLTAGLDMIAHCAAVTGFNLSAETYDQVNVGGTAQVLAFTAACGLPMLHVSTAYVCGETDGAIAEAPTQAERFVNHYEASKAAGEALVLAAQRAGQVAAIARPSIVVGRWTDGAVGGFSNMYQLIRLVAEGRTGAIPAAPGAALDLVPIDHVVDALADIAERLPAANGRIFHLASGRPVPVAAMARLARSFPQLHPPRFVAPDQFDPACLTARQRWLHEQVTGLYASYLLRAPTFATANLAALSGRVCPPTDGAFLRRMIGHAIAAGFLRDADAATVQRTSG